jgi:hypothetical protein
MIVHLVRNPRTPMINKEVDPEPADSDVLGPSKVKT